MEGVESCLRLELNLATLELSERVEVRTYHLDLDLDLDLDLEALREYTSVQLHRMRQERARA